MKPRGNPERYLLHLVGLEQVGDLPRAKHTVHNFEELFVDHLGVVEEERGRFLFHTGPRVQDLEVFAELRQPVQLGNRDLKGG